MKNWSLSNIFKGDKTIWMVFFLLCAISIVEVYSASSSLSYKGGNYWGPIIKHSGTIFLGFLSMVVVMNIPCKYYKIVTLPLLIFAAITQVLVYKIGESTNDANRWMEIMGIQFQPSEFGKMALVLCCAQVLSALQKQDGAQPRAFWYIFWPSCIIIGLIAPENLSTAVLTGSTVFLMMFVGRVPLRLLGKFVGVILILVGLVIGSVMLFGHAEEKPSQKAILTEVVQQEEPKEESNIEKLLHRMDTWKSRILKFSDDTYISPDDYDLDKDGQVAHANIAVASSNIIGKGPGNSNERDFLSQAFSDFIYAIIIEEMGIGGAFFVAFLYVVLLFRAGKIANRCENSFPAFLAMGIAFLLVTQALFNMAVAVGLAPVTGQPLPLISKGGTSTIINCAYIGALLSISRFAQRREDLKPANAKTENIRA